MPPTNPLRSRLAILALTVIAGVAAAAVGLWPGPRPHNLVIFVADGLRSDMVTDGFAPQMAALRREGVDFHNSHSLYPTVTTPNASAIAVGHGLGDTGDYGNILYVGAPTASDSPSPFANLENDETLGRMNARYDGDYLNETSLLAQARRRGFSTAAIGKLGPTAIQDVAVRASDGEVIIDDSTGHPGGVPLAPDLQAAIRGAGLDPAAEDRGLNGDPGDAVRSGVHVANVQQQNWFVAVATKVLLPRFRRAGRPFILVFWSRDPDGTQHFNGDSLNRLVPGINGPTSLAGIRNADEDLGQLRAALKALGLEKTTDIVVTSDHGFSVTSKQSATSPSARRRYPDVPAGFLPRGFLSLDLAEVLNADLFDANGLPVNWRGGEHPRSDAELIGPDPAHPIVAVAANGGSDLLYLFGKDPRAQALTIAAALERQDYVGGLFVADALGPVPGALPLSAAGLKGSALTRSPSMIVGFRSASTGCPDQEICAAEVADTEYQQGQGIHGSFSRADTHNVMAAWGPDFKAGFKDPLPVSNADWAPTLAAVLHLNLQPRGAMVGRVLSEGLVNGGLGRSRASILRSRPGVGGFRTVLDLQTVGRERYFDAAGDPGRIVGLVP